MDATAGRSDQSAVLLRWLVSDQIGGAVEPILPLELTIAVHRPADHGSELVLNAGGGLEQLPASFNKPVDTMMVPVTNM